MDDALEYFQKVAIGLVPANIETAEQAAYRLGFVLKNRQRYDESLDVFKQLGEKVVNNGTKMDALLMVAALQMEFGKEDYGVLPDSERIALYTNSAATCERIINNPEVKPEVQVIAELMHFENYYHMQNYSEAIQLGEKFMNKWLPKVEKSLETGQGFNPSRYLITGMTYLSFAYYGDARYEDCVKITDMVNSGLWGKDDPYEAFNVFAYGFLYKSMALEKMGRKEEASAAMNLGSATYPEWFQLVPSQVANQWEKREGGSLE